MVTRKETFKAFNWVKNFRVSALNYSLRYVAKTSSGFEHQIDFLKDESELPRKGFLDEYSLRKMIETSAFVKIYQIFYFLNMWLKCFAGTKTTPMLQPNLYGTLIWTALLSGVGLHHSGPKKLYINWTRTSINLERKPRKCLKTIKPQKMAPKNALNLIIFLIAFERLDAWSTCTWESLKARTKF